MRTAAESPTDPGGRATTGLVADLGVLALVMGVAASFIRLFDGWEFLGRVGLVVVLSWGTAVLLRRIGVGITLTSVAHTAVGVLVLGAVFLPSSTFLMIPTSETLSSARLEVTNAFQGIRQMVPPVQASTGFLIVVSAGLWLLTLYADTAARRVGAVIQAVVPFLVTFLVVGVPGNGTGRTQAIAIFLTALTSYSAAVQFDRYRQMPWVGGNGHSAAGYLARNTVVIAAFGSAIALLAVVALPNQTRRIDLRDIGKGPGERTVVSPFVSITSLLGPQSNTEMFRVRSDSPTYWRLTALSSFDEERNIWVSHGTYSPTRGTLPRSTSDSTPTTRLRQDFQITDLSSPWLPAAFEPARISGDAEVTYDRSSSSLITDGDDQSQNSYTVWSELPDFAPITDVVDQRGILNRSRADLDPELSRVPDLPLAVERTFDEVAGATRNPFRKLLLLQDWFRSTFTYDEDVDYSRAADPVSQFFRDRRGFCQQFASSFALLARYAGLPSRVAVGFTSGDSSISADDGPDGSADTEFVVRGRHAHAWPEVYFSGFGWVPFEPTPGRGNPATTSFTGVAAAQAMPPEAPSTTVPATTVTTPTTTAAAPTTVPQGTNQSADSAPDGGRMPVLVVLLGLALISVAGWAVFVGARRRHIARARELDEAELIGQAWQRCLHALASLGVVIASSETPLEFAHRAGDQLSEIARKSAELSSAAPLTDAETIATGHTAPIAELQLLADAETFRLFGDHSDHVHDGDDPGSEGSGASVNVYATGSTPERGGLSAEAVNADLAATAIAAWSKQRSRRSLSPALQSGRP